MVAVGPVRLCALCGISDRNGKEISIRGYTLLRSIAKRERAGRTGSTSFGTILLCDLCVAENRRGAVGRTIGFRSPPASL